MRNFINLRHNKAHLAPVKRREGMEEDGKSSIAAAVDQKYIARGTRSSGIRLDGGALRIGLETGY